MKELSGLRRLRLVDAAEAQLFYQRLNEVVDWIKEKDPILKIKDVPNDKDSVQVYLKKMTDILSEMETGGVDKKVEGLKVTSDTMVERDHFDAPNIRTKMTDLTELHENFKSLLIEQRQSLLDQMAVIEFINVNTYLCNISTYITVERRGGRWWIMLIQFQSKTLSSRFI